MIIKATLRPADSQAGNTIEVPLQTSFHTPEGRFPASIRSTKKGSQSWSSNQPMIRFIFNVNVPGSNIQYLAKLDLPENMNEGSDLWNVLCRLVGRKVLQECSGKTFDLNKLVGTPCDIETQHNHEYREDHDFPLVIVTDLQETGTWEAANAKCAPKAQN